jgi:uncharacterized protein (TIGR02996 family)
MRGREMTDEAGLWRAIRERPGDDLPRLAYADWLEERGDERAALVRTHLLLRSSPPDHPCRQEGEPLLSRLRRTVDPTWLEVIEPDRPPPAWVHHEDRFCACYPKHPRRSRRGPALHGEIQDTECAGWVKLLALIERAAEDGREMFRPRDELTPEEWAQIITLPPSIGKLKAVRDLVLYGSHLVRIPPEVGELEGLTRFTPYTSYRLHWYPYEITRCPNLRDSTVSTRSLYGNEKNRMTFPRLDPYPALRGVAPAEAERECSVCRRPFTDLGRHRVWISLRVATDVLPLLVNACSDSCVRSLPPPASGYPHRPHRGGPGLPPAAD